MKMAVLFCTCAMLGPGFSMAQSGASTPGFEVASVKSAPPGATERSVSNKPGPRLVTSNATVRQLIYLAYQVMPFQVFGGPDWVDSSGFDIDAKAADPRTTQAEFREMMQGLLADRFHLHLHRETRSLPVYALVVSKGGSKLAPAGSDDPDVGVRVEGPGKMTGVRATMTMFATALSRPLRSQVIDRTGLQGSYSFTLRFAPDQVSAQSNDVALADGPSIFAAIQEQLGLRLETAKGPVEVLVIDAIQKPSEN
jgi:uncharacterized protein (TIGR03435 family)